MSQFDYGRSKETADRLIFRFGQTGQLRRTATSGTGYDPTSGAVTDHDATIVVLGYRNFEVDGTRVRASDKRVLLAKESLAITPTTADKLLIGGVEHAIINVQPLSPGGTVVLFEIQARR